MNTEKHYHQHPPSVLLEWLDLAITYVHCGLGNDLTDQTRLALMDVRTFMTQPAQAYCCLHYQPCEYHEAFGTTPSTVKVVRSERFGVSLSAPGCPSSSAAGRADRCGLFSWPRRCGEDDGVVVCRDVAQIDRATVAE